MFIILLYHIVKHSLALFLELLYFFINTVFHADLIRKQFLHGVGYRPLWRVFHKISCRSINFEKDDKSLFSKNDSNYTASLPATLAYVSSLLPRLSSS